MVNSDIPTSDRARKRKPGPKKADERLVAQKTFLEAFAQKGIIRFACEAASIHRDTVNDWLTRYPAFKQAYEEMALPDANDRIEEEIHRRAVEGVDEPLVSNGMLVYEFVPVLKPDGTPVLDDKGKPKYERGKQITKRVYSDALLLALAKRRIPAYSDKGKLEVTGKDGGPVEYADVSAEIQRRLARLSEAQRTESVSG